MCKNKLFTIALTMCAIALGTQSCSEDSDSQENVAVTGITVTPDKKTLLEGDTVTLVADIFPAQASDKSVTWQSNDTAIATVSDKGLVRAVAAGEANITVTSVANSAKTATCVITVSSTFSVSLNASSLLIPVEATRTLRATITPESVSQEVSWSSSNTGAVTVDAHGVITAVAPGTATVKAASVLDASRTAECVVTVADVSVTASKWLVGWWTFEDENNLEKATVGEDLVATGDFTLIDDPNDAEKAVKPEENSFYTIYHNIGANGGSEEYTNEYTLMMDIRGSAEKFAGWLSVFNTYEDNSGDGVLWIDEDGLIGYAALGGYSSTGLTADTWHRVVIAAKLGEGSFKVYIDGALVFTGSEGIELDCFVSLYPDVVYIGYDGSGYSGPEFADVKMWSIQLTDQQVSELGNP